MYTLLVVAVLTLDVLERLPWEEVALESVLLAGEVVAFADCRGSALGRGSGLVCWSGRRKEKRKEKEGRNEGGKKLVEVEVEVKVSTA